MRGNVRKLPSKTSRVRVAEINIPMWCNGDTPALEAAGRNVHCRFESCHRYRGSEVRLLGGIHWVDVFRYDVRVSCKATHAGVAGVGLSHVLVKRSTHVRFVSPAPCPPSPIGRGGPLKTDRLRVRVTRWAPWVRLHWDADRAVNSEPPAR